MEIARISIDKIHAAAYNPRKDLQPGDVEYDNLEHSIERFGYVDPIIWNKRTGNIVGGHQRYKILASRGDTEIEVSVVDLSEEEEKAFNVALNKINGQWDDEKLSELLREISNSDIDVLITGFDDIELDAMLNSNIGDDLSGFFKESQTAEKPPKMTVCPFCGKEHEI